MIIVEQSLHDDESEFTISIFSDNDIQLDKEVCIITKFLLACKGVEVDDYSLYDDYPIYRFAVFLKRDYKRNFSQLLKKLDDNLMLYCKSKIYCIT